MSSEVLAVWSTELLNFDDCDDCYIVQAVDELLLSKDKQHPPSLPEFLESVRRIKSPLRPVPSFLPPTQEAKEIRNGVWEHRYAVQGAFALYLSENPGKRIAIPPNEMELTAMEIAEIKDQQTAIRERVVNYYKQHGEYPDGLPATKRELDALERKLFGASEVPA